VNTPTTQLLLRYVEEKVQK